MSVFMVASVVRAPARSPVLLWPLSVARSARPLYSERQKRPSRALSVAIVLAAASALRACAIRFASRSRLVEPTIVSQRSACRPFCAAVRDASSLFMVLLASSELATDLSTSATASLGLNVPFGWETYGGPSAIAALTPGVQATVVGRVVKIFIKTTTRKKMRLTEAMIEDDSGERLRVAWFNNPYVVKNLNQGDRVAIAGMVKAGYGGVPEMQSPHYERLDGDPDAQPSRVGGLMPKYHLVDGLSSRKMARWVESALPLAGRLEDVLPEEVRQRHRL